MDRSRSHVADDTIRRWDRAFTALSAEPRRQVVRSLIDVAAGESIRLPEAVSNSSMATEFDQLRIRLRHHHLPLLAEAELVQWEDDPLRAYRGRDFEEVSVIIESLYANADEIPDRLVSGCRTLERKRESSSSECGLSG
ncbi:hypothetical protein [Natrinema versiforme]|uniref:Uncharacterized protein n=1 Tax=Natrinema versiforme JCM 10478 TaxID=1227496 RepID=L9XRS5_9EURY|nr:hypothetical protein [Natrinema versiforme]ELY64465.1 hypothetical protein C489_16969 [Natrinema versiforme JCM 10478]